MNLSERDRQCVWHPFTQEKTATLPIAVRRGSGAYLYDENDKPYLDLVSSWWVNLHGHAHPAIAKSIYDQALTLEHVIFAGFTHEPAVRLCEGLQTILDPFLTRFFFSDNGSTSVEVALKMALQYWSNQGKGHKTRFLSFEGGYHGDTFGAMSLGAQSGYHDAFEALLFEVLSLPYPATWEGDADCERKEVACLDQLDKYLAQEGDKIAAMILEPLVQGASGMRMCRPIFLNALLDKLRSNGILVIFDEVMTGFGRTGTHFAYQQLAMVPDILCISKGISGGFLPLALTVCTESLYQAFLSDEWKHALAHGHSYTANPLACAAANTSLEILLAPGTAEAMQRIEKSHREGLKALTQASSRVSQCRVQGTIAAFEVTSCDPQSLTARLRKAFLEAGLLIRPLGNTIYLLPPYCVTEAELKRAYDTILEILDKID